MHFVQQILFQTPVLLVCITGMIIAIVFWRRYPVPCMLTMIASGLLLLATLLHPLIFQLTLSVDTLKRATFLGLFGLATNILRAASFGLLLAAVFSRRRTAPASA